MDDPVRTRCLDRLAWLRTGAVTATAIGLVLAISVPHSASASPQLAISPLGYRIEHIEQVPGARRTYDLTARAGVTNSGDPALDVSAVLRRSSP